jgi:hypothetical protein
MKRTFCQNKHNGTGQELKMQIRTKHLKDKGGAIEIN